MFEALQHGVAPLRVVNQGVKVVRWSCSVMCVHCEEGMLELLDSTHCSEMSEKRER